MGLELRSPPLWTGWVPPLGCRNILSTPLSQHWPYPLLPLRVCPRSVWGESLQTLRGSWDWSCFYKSRTCRNNISALGLNPISSCLGPWTLLLMPLTPSSCGTAVATCRPQESWLLRFLLASDAAYQVTVTNSFLDGLALHHLLPSSSSSSSACFRPSGTQKDWQRNSFPRCDLTSCKKHVLPSLLPNSPTLHIQGSLSGVGKWIHSNAAWGMS